MARAFWKGSISFGLVEIPVSLRPALQSDDLSFTLLNREDFAPVGYPGRAGAWLKTKCSSSQEFVIGGFTEPEGARSGLGALLVAEISFGSWTDDGKLGRPSFRGLREDKAARDVVREAPSSPGAASRSSSRSAPKKMPPVRRRPPDTPTRRPPPVRDPNPKPPVEDPPQKPRKKPMRDPVDQGVAAALTHPDRVRYPESDVTKLDLARYLHRVAQTLSLSRIRSAAARARR